MMQDLPFMKQMGLIGKRPERVRCGQGFVLLASQTVNFKPGKNADFLKHKDAAQLLIGAEYEVGQNMKLPGWLGKTLD